MTSQTLLEYSRPWWHPELYSLRRPFLLQRMKIAQIIREFFIQQNFVEVETPILQYSPGNDLHIHPFSTWLETEGESPDNFHKMYLHTSPEFACKKLLAAGEKKLFTFARVFRNRESSTLHSPEFTLLEWYRAEESYEKLMEDCAQLLQKIAYCLPVDCFAFKDKKVDPFQTFERWTLQEAFQHYAGLDLKAYLPDYPEGVAEREAEQESFTFEIDKPLYSACMRNANLCGAFAQAAQNVGVRVAREDTWSDIFTRLVGEKIEPHLGRGVGSILYEYPLSEGALARRKYSEPWLAERFELYVCGVELANGFSELTDPKEQKERFLTAMAERKRLYGVCSPLDEDFLAALKDMPAACGIALGFDRLVMLATQASHIQQVLWAPVRP